MSQTLMKTFNEWSSLGFKILKGSKATWVEGVAMFSVEQVTPTTIAGIKYLASLPKPTDPSPKPEDDLPF